MMEEYRLQHWMADISREGKAIWTGGSPAYLYERHLRFVFTIEFISVVLYCGIVSYAVAWWLGHMPRLKKILRRTWEVDLIGFPPTLILQSLFIVKN